MPCRRSWRARRRRLAGWACRTCAATSQDSSRLLQRASSSVPRGNSNGPSCWPPRSTTHTLAGCAIAAQREGLLPVNQISLEFYGRVAYHDYEGISYDLDERRRLVRDLGDKPVMIMRNHGLLTVGTTVAQAFLRMFYLEKACEIQLAAQSTGQALLLPSKKICRKAERQFNAPAPPPEAHLVNEPNDLAWSALLRLLDRLDSSYRL
ncbi:MAG: hypothetical protein EBX78_11800 [Gammaproteobacteria bacterium]|nr:hypothetical protein [Gammaproteobacteria bacterium]